MRLLMRVWYVDPFINGKAESDFRQIYSRAHALAAVFRGVNDYLNNRLRTHNVHAEIVVSLSPTNNVR